MPQSDVAAIVLAAGTGDRFGGAKQFARVGSARLVDLSVRGVAPVAGDVIVVVPPGFEWDGEGVGVAGGATRAESVRNGLAQVPARAAFVIVHDAAHPLATPDLAARVVAAVREGADGAVPVLATRETIAHTDGAMLGAAVPRDGLVQVQMPHAFRATVLRAAHADPVSASDDATLVQALGRRVVTIDGDPENIHVTTPAELAFVDTITRAARRLP
jgi:2-C-methyl-D-erythritol 4-phosphate cytidylyltransferase